MKNLKIFALVVVALTTSYCTKDSSEDLPQDQPQQQEVSPEILSKLESMGFDTKTKSPKYSDSNTIIVEGDILMNKKTILDYNLQKQAYIDIVSCNNIRNVTVLNNLGNTPAGRSIQEGMNLWNNVRNSTVRFVLVNRAPADITIEAGFIAFRVPADARFPSNRRVGNRIRVNETVTAFDGRPITQRQWSRIITHELGHCIGLLHSTDEFFGTHVQGTVVNDGFSIMDVSEDVGAPGSLENAADVSRNDKIAIELMYSDRRDRLCR